MFQAGAYTKLHILIVPLRVAGKRCRLIRRLAAPRPLVEARLASCATCVALVQFIRANRRANPAPRSLRPLRCTQQKTFLPAGEQQQVARRRRLVFKASACVPRAFKHRLLSLKLQASSDPKAAASGALLVALAPRRRRADEERLLNFTHLQLSRYELRALKELALCYRERRGK